MWIRLPKLRPLNRGNGRLVLREVADEDVRRLTQDQHEQPAQRAAAPQGQGQRAAVTQFLLRGKPEQARVFRRLLDEMGPLPLPVPRSRLAYPAVEPSADRAPLHELVAHANATTGSNRMCKARALGPDASRQVAQELRLQSGGLLTAQSTASNGREWVALVGHVVPGSGGLSCAYQVC